MYFPAIHDEKTTYANYLEMELDALRNAAHGMTDEQARSTPLRSEMSLAGLLKHSAHVMAVALAGAGNEGHDAIDPHDFYGSFTLTDDESLEGILAIVDDLKPRYLQMCQSADPDSELEMAPMPWFGVMEATPVKLRYLLVHHIEEFARHAGHADIIREEIDGAKAAELSAAVEGREANEFVTPWTPDGS